ncbi:MAG: hypothetical protein NTX44_12440 [Ignavibacteriales bacterium]|nr:hypothetical protein [Ignavibacteriales bacterium]
MNEQKDVAGEKLPEEESQFQHLVIVIVLALLLGFLAGFLSHDHLVHFAPDHLDWKSWYPR